MRPRRQLRPVALLTALAAALLVPLLAACGGDDGTGSATTPTAATTAAPDLPRVLVTTTVLGALVRDVAGDRAEVEVLMPNGVDPHDFQPSAKDAERLQEADLIVVNGLDLEEGLEDAISEAERAGIPVFAATDHVRLRELGEEEGGHSHGDEAGHSHEGEEGHSHEGEEGHSHDTEKGSGGEEEHAHGSEDPHIWVDPVRMSQVVGALAPAMRRELGVDVADRAADLRSRLGALHRELLTQSRTIPAADRKLVTGHESMGYFADRYAFELVGAVIPSLSSQAEPSARQMSELVEVIREEDVPVLFTEIGTPPPVAEAIADEAGVRVVELASHNLPEDGSYLSFMRGLMDGVVQGLRPAS